MTNGFPLIHIGKLSSADGANEELLFMRQVADDEYCWFREDRSGMERITEIMGSTPRKAVRSAQQFWGEKGFSSLYCGTRYSTIPQDEHGTPALFCQMVASYSANNTDGSYFDDLAGHECYVDFAPDDSLDLWYQLREDERL